ncbi:uncharacterized protein RJT20DRAFT_132222 [Scheffersomyces xylosifermentans]|uniref:uncharacterized protein n=1 Tax=Scheffersomyces xylosifermentans TaxID=1304137 RepID=UPI00315CE2F3
MFPNTQTSLDPPSTSSSTSSGASASTSASSFTLSSVPQNVVSDIFAKDPHQLLLAHLYNYLKEAGLHESARSLLSESNHVPHNVKNGAMASAVTDAQMVLNGAPSQDPFLLQWWTLLWTIQSNMNPNLNQLFNKTTDPQQQFNQQLLHQQQLQLQFQQQLQNQNQNSQLNTGALQQNIIGANGAAVNQNGLAGLNPNHLQQQQQFIQQRLLLQQQQLQQQKQQNQQSGQNPQQNLQQLQNQQANQAGPGQRQGSVSSVSSGVVPISSNANNRMLPPNSAGAAPITSAQNTPKNVNLHQYQQQLGLQQMKLQYQQNAQQGQQGVKGGSNGANMVGPGPGFTPGVGPNGSQLQSPLLMNGQQPTPQQQHAQQQLQQQAQKQKVSSMNDINAYQQNLLRMENQNNLQEKQFLMKQQQVQNPVQSQNGNSLVPPTPQFSGTSPLQQQQQQPMNSGANGQAVPNQNGTLDNNQLMLQQQQHQQEMMFQMSMLQQQQQQQNMIPPQMQFQQQNNGANNNNGVNNNGNNAMLIMGNDTESILAAAAAQNRSSGPMPANIAAGTQITAANGAAMNSMLEAATSAILSNAGNKDQSNGVSGINPNDSMAQQQLQLNLQYQLQQERLKLIQQQGSMNSADNSMLSNGHMNGGGNVGNGVLDGVKDPNTNHNSGLIESDWMSSMGSGPGFP